MAFDDSLIGSNDFDPKSATEDLIRRTSDEPLPDVLDPRMLNTRLARKLGREPKAVAAPTPPKTDDKLDFSSQAAPAPNAEPSEAGDPNGLDFTSQVQQPAPAPAPGMNIGGPTALAKGLVTGAAEGVGGIMQGAARLGNQAAPYLESLQYDQYGNVIGQAPVKPPAPIEQNSLYQAGGKLAHTDLENIYREQLGLPAKPPLMSPEERDSFTGRLGTMAGGVAPYAAVAAVGGLALGAAAGFAGMGADVYGKVYEDAKAKGADDATATTAASKAGTAGAILGALPLGSTALAKKVIASTLAKIALGSVTFASTNEATEYVLQEIAKDYDPTAGYHPELKRIIASLILGTGLHAFEGKKPETRQDTANDTANGTTSPPDVNGPSLNGPDEGGPGPDAGRARSEQEARDWQRNGWDNQARGDTSGPGGPERPGERPRTRAEAESEASGPQAPKGGVGSDFKFATPEKRATMERLVDTISRRNSWGLDVKKMSDAELWNAVLSDQQQAAGAKSSEATPETPEEAQQREQHASKQTEDADLKKAFGWMTDAQIQSMTPDMRQVWVNRARGMNGGKAKTAEAEQSARTKTAEAERPPEMEMPGEAPNHGDLVSGEDANLRNFASSAEKPAEAASSQGENLKQAPNTGRREAPIVPKTADDVVAAQPAEPKSAAQAQAENYQHAHMELPHLGLAGQHSLSIETGVGQTRKGPPGPDGEPEWEVKLEHGAYGRIKGTRGADGQPLDIMVGPHPSSPHVFIINQHDPKTGKFDELKVQAGYRTPIDAMHAYVNSYDDGATGRIGGMVAMTAEQFHAWLKHGNHAAAVAHGDAKAVLARAFPKAGEAVTEGGARVEKVASSPGLHNAGEEAHLPLTEASTEAAVVDVPKGSLPRDANEAIGRPAVITNPKRESFKADQKLSLLEFLADRGGLAPHAELRKLGLGNSHRVQIPGRKGFFSLVKNGGWDLDTAREAAEELGYLQGDSDNVTSTIRHLLDAIDTELRGNKLYPYQGEGQRTGVEKRLDTEREEHDRAKAQELIDELDEAGHGEMGPELKARTLHFMAQGMDPDTAVDHAMAALNAEDATAAEIDAIYGDGAYDEVHAGNPYESGPPDEVEGGEGYRRSQGPPDGTGEHEPETGSAGREDGDAGRKADTEDQGTGRDETTGEGGPVREPARAKQRATGRRKAAGDETGNAARHQPAAEAADDAAVEHSGKVAAASEDIDDFLKHIESEIAAGRMDAEISPTRSLGAFRAVAEQRGWTYGAYGKGKALWSPDRKHVIFPSVSVEGNHVTAQWGTPGEGITPPGGTETGADNKQQTVIPGAEKASDKTMAQRGAEAPLKPKANQKPADDGLFGDGHKQTDLLDIAKSPKEPIISPPESPDGISLPVHDGDARAKSEAVPPVAGQRGIGSSGEHESAGSRPSVPEDSGREPAAADTSDKAGGGGAGEGDSVRVSGRHADAESGREERAVQRGARAVKGENYRIEPGALAEDRSPRTKGVDNVNAIRLANRIVDEARPATAAEQHQLARYVGWGGLKNAFPDADGNIAKGFEHIAADLKEVLTPEEYDTARRSIQYAHYTAEDVIDAMWGVALRLGFKGGHVFEPGMGVGHFAGLMPADVAAHTVYNGVEMDHVSARIASLLYPRWSVRREDFTKMPLAESAFDLAIGNPPFADISIQSDPKYAKNKFLLHDYFFAKSLDGVRPGGLLAFVTSAGTMNKRDPAAREYMAERAEFVGGIRLPSNAFKKNAGTEVTTDILILRKLMPGEEAKNWAWTQVERVTLPGPDGKPVTDYMSRYFAEHPEMVLGEQDFADKLYEGRYSVKAPKGFDLKAELAKAIENLPRNIMGEAETPKARAEADFEGTEKKDGSYYLKDGNLFQQRGGAGFEVERRGKGVEGGKTAAEIDRITALVPIRDALRETFAADLADDIGAGQRARLKLNQTYDAFVKKFGPINKAEIQRRRPTSIQAEAARSEAREEARYAGQPFDEGSFDPSRMIAAGKSLTEIARARKAAIDEQGAKYREGDFNSEEMPDIIIDKRPNIEPFIDDQESYRLRAIEHYDEPTGKAQKGDVFFKNVISKDKPPEIKSVHDAVLHVLNQKGSLDIDAVAGMVDKSRTETIEALGDGIYQVPGTTDTWETGEKYLSGNVRKKLVLAKAAAEKNPVFRRNVDALEAAQPAPLAPSQIGASLGMPWIPPDVIEKFATDALGLEKLRATYIPAVANWTVSGDTDSLAASTTWGTARRNATALIGDALNRQSPKIYDRNDDGSSTLNVTATQAAAEKMQAIRDKFNEWVFSDEKRADRLANFYNENYNNIVVQEFNGDYLTTPGISESWSWRPHQTRVIARIIQNGNTYMAHAVGAGKTSAMIGAGMEMRRLGLVKKPAYAVPNHMLAQFTKEFYEQYPTARIMVADERAFHTDRRKQFMANVALSDLDAVIMTHSSFGMIPVSNEFQDQVIEEQLDEYRHALADMQKGQDNRITRSRIEKQIERLEQRLSGKSTRKRDAVFNFDEMGIDFLFVDEAHLFRKLDFTTQMSNLKGVTPQGSGASWDLYVKSKLLEKRNPGRSLVLASGTPVTNTMAELFTVSRYLQPRELRERQLDQFDAWAGAFGENVTELEQDAAGGYKPVSRFAKFVNVSELSAMVRQVMDVVTSRQLEQYVVRPKLKGGKRIMNLAEKSPALDRYQASLAARMKAMEGRGKPKPGDDIMLKVIGDGRHAAIDMRLVGADKGDADHPSKLDLLVENVARLHKQTKAQKLYRPKNGAYDMSKPADVGPATQMIFANLGISGTRGFSVPDYVRSELVRHGVPRDEIALIADYKSHVAKQRLFNDMNEGKVRVLIGSTAKMATGVNAQRRLYAIHNLDPLWYPSDDEQRNGRGLRQGNMNPEIEIHDYSTKGTYDSTMWGMMEKKARFIQGFFEGDPSLRTMDDLGEASQYEQAKALTTNDPRLMRLTELRQELEKANRRKAAFDNERYAVRRRRADSKSDLQHYGAREIEIEKDIAQRVPLAGDAFKAKIGRETFDKRVDFGEALLRRLDGIATKENSGRHIPIGEISGFSLVATPQFIVDHMAVHLDLKRNGGRESHITVGTSGLGAVRSMEAIISGFDSDLSHVREKIKTASKFISESEADADKKFTGDADMAKLAAEIAVLQAEMSAKKEEPAPSEPEDGEQTLGAIRESIGAPTKPYEGNQRADSFPAFETRPGAAPRGLTGQAYVLQRGRESAGTFNPFGNEHMVAFDQNGFVVGDKQGTPFEIKIPSELISYMMVPGNYVVVHHNHPSGRTLSAPDIEALAYPGLLTIWAHGHDGTVFGASLTENARARLPDNIVDSKIMLLNAYKDVESRIENVLQSFLNIDKIHTSPHYEGIKKITNEVWQHLVLSVLAAADIVEYRSNFSTPTEFDAVAGLSQVLRDAIPDVKRNFFNAAAKPSANAVRRPDPARHPGSVGVLFDKTALLPRFRDKGLVSQERAGNDREEEAGFPVDNSGQGRLLDTLPGLDHSLGAIDYTLNDILGKRLLGRLGDLNATEMRVQLQDKFARVKNVEEDKGNTDTGLSAYQAESLYYGRTGQRLETLKEHVVDPIIREMKGRSIDLDSMDKFLYARHAVERNNLVGRLYPAGHDFNRATSDPTVKGASGMSNSEANSYIGRLRADGKLADYQAVGRMVDALNFRTRQTLFNSGLIDRDTFDALNSQYRYYVPLRGWQEGGDEGDLPHAGKGMDTRAKAFKQAFGRKSLAASPLAYSIMQAEQAIVKGEKNKVGNVFLKFALANPDPDLWTINRPEPRKYVSKVTGMATSSPTWDMSDPRTFVTRVNGRANLIQFKGADGANLARALKDMGSSNVHSAVRMMAAVTHTMARLATAWNPEFMIPNLVRDVGEAFINLGEQRQRDFAWKFWKRILPAIAGSTLAIAGKTPAPGSTMAAYVDAFHEFDSAGGRVRFFGIDDPDVIEKNVEKRLKRLSGGVINSIKDMGEKAGKALEIMGGGIENATRLAAYMTAREFGMSAPDAGMLARNLTVNFNKNGELGSAIGSAYMFANAGVQGQARMLRALHPKNRRVWMAVGALATAGVMSTSFNIGIGGYDKAGVANYMKIPSWERDKNIIIMGPGETYGKIPLPYGYAPFHVLGAHATTVLMGQEKPAAAAAAVFGSIASAFNPLGEEEALITTLVPTALRPAVHIHYNENWTGRPLYPARDSDKGKPESQQSFRSDTAASKAITEELNSLSGGDRYRPGAIDIHPGSLDHVFGAITGGVGKFFKNIVDTVVNGWNGQPWEASKTPILRRFVGKLDHARADSDAYYNVREEAKEDANRIRQAKQDIRSGADEQAARAFLNAAPGGRQKIIFDRADKQMRRLRAEEDRINNSPQPYEAKKAALDAIRLQMRDVQNRARAESARLKGDQQQRDRLYVSPNRSQP